MSRIAVIKKKKLAQGHPASKWQPPDPNPDLFDSRTSALNHYVALITVIP